ncbi:MAG: V-type ATP synthase subunit E [Candidatus Thermoplasmatota archaeon]
MSVESIIKRIVADAEREAKRIIDESRVEVERIITKAREESSKEAERIISEGRVKCETLRRNMLSRAEHEMKRDLFSERERCIEECFNQAVRALSSLPSDKYMDIVRGFIKKGKELLGEGCMVLITREEDRKVAENEHVIVKGTTKGIGGVVVLSSDERVSVDYTFDGLLKRMKDDLRRKVGGMLFSDY